MSTVRPLSIRKLRAEMELKNLSLIDVSRRSGVKYGSCSQILNGRLIDAVRLAKIRRAIATARQPKELAAV